MTVHTANRAMEKIVRTSKKSTILRATWLEMYANIFLHVIKIHEMKHFQTNSTSKILKIINMHEFLKFLIVGY